MSGYKVASVGAAGTLIVHKPGSRAEFRAALLRKLPFVAQVTLCDGKDLLRLKRQDPFVAEPLPPDAVRFVSVLPRGGSPRVALPVNYPCDGQWLVRVISRQGQFVFGMYRRHMKTIGYLGQIDKLYGVPATTRNWNTIMTVVRLLQEPRK